MPRWLLRMWCGLQGFLQSIVMMPRCSSCTTSPPSVAWPMPLPPCGVSSAGGHFVPDASTKWLVSVLMVLFCWFSPIWGVPAYPSLGTLPLARQWHVARMLEHLVVDGTTFQFVKAAGIELFSFNLRGTKLTLFTLFWQLWRCTFLSAPMLVDVCVRERGEAMARRQAGALRAASGRCGLAGPQK